MVRFFFREKVVVIIIKCTHYFTPNICWIFREKVVVQANKTNIILQGQGYLDTIIEWNDTANSTGGTSYSYSFAVFASKFTAYNISFKVSNFLDILNSYLHILLHGEILIIHLDCVKRTEHFSSTFTRRGWSTSSGTESYRWSSRILWMWFLWCAGHTQWW